MPKSHFLILRDLWILQMSDIGLADRIMQIMGGKSSLREEGRMRRKRRNLAGIGRIWGLELL